MSVFPLQPVTYFNSQPHEEADSGAYEAEIDEVKISTHSLTRRLTI